MKLFGFEIIKNYVQPPAEVKYGEFTITPTPVIIVPADVTNYKAAWISAHSQYTQQRGVIYDMYQNALDFDAHLKAVIEKRVLATVGKRLQYVIADEPNEAAQAMLQSPRFGDFLTDLVMTKLWGMGLFEFKPKKWNSQSLFDYSLIPIKHVDPYQKTVRQLQYSASNGDKSYDGAKNVIFVGQSDCGGLLQQLTLLSLYKREGINGWTQYAQLAATNFKKIKYRGVTPDAAKRATLRETVMNAGKGVLDYNGEDMDIQESNQTSSSQNELFEGFIAYLDEQITKLVLGQTMTSEDGSSRSQAEVHERTQETIFDADSKMVLDILNYDFYEIQTMFGVPTGGVWSYVDNVTSKQTSEVEFDLKLKELGYIFSQEQIAEKYGLNVNTTGIAI